MSQRNPYAAPQARVEDREASGPGLEKLISGQKLMIYAILINLFAIGLSVALERPADTQNWEAIQILFGIASTLLAVVGILRLAGGFGWGIVGRILLVILMLLPLVNLITMLVLNGRATKALRKSGFKVGFLGVSR